MAIVQNKPPVVRTIGNAVIKQIKAERGDHGILNANRNNFGFTQNIAVYNFTDRPVYVKTQGNATFVVHPIRHLVGSSTARSHIEVRVTSGVSGRVDFNATLELMERLLDDGLYMSPEAHGLKEKLQSLIAANAFKPQHNKVDVFSPYIVDEANFPTDDTIVYVKECNLTLSFSKETTLEHHPQSSEAWSSPDVRSYQEARQAAGNFIRVVDNEDHHQNWFYYSAKHVVEVKSVHDASKENGVYFTKLVYKDGANRLENDFATFEEAGVKFGVYTTREEALTGGNPEQLASIEETKWKVQLEAARKELDEVRLENDLVKNKHERELLDVKRDAAVVKENIEMKQVERKAKVEKKSSKHKEKHEKRSLDRKEKHEEKTLAIKAAETAIKFGPVILTAALAITATMLSTRNNNSKREMSDILTGVQPIDQYQLRNIIDRSDDELDRIFQGKKGTFENIERKGDKFIHKEKDKITEYDRRGNVVSEKRIHRC